MALNFFNVNSVYTKNKYLHKEDARALIQWVKDQPHLPNINEPQAILFLHRWNYELETAKTAVDTYFTLRTYRSDAFCKGDSLNSPFKDYLDMFLCTVLPKKSFKGYSVYFCKFMKPDVNRYTPHETIKWFDTVLSLDMYKKGPSEGYIFIVDTNNFKLEMVVKNDVINFRTFFYYIQDVVPVKFKQYHFINNTLVPYMDKILAMIKPFMEKELADELYVHQTLADLYQHVPQSCLPKDYGGSEESVAALHGKMKENILKNKALLDWTDEQFVDESKRGNKSTKIIDLLERGSIRNGKFEVD